jgi:hypothetical protein
MRAADFGPDSSALLTDWVLEGAEDLLLGLWRGRARGEEGRQARCNAPTDRDEGLGDHHL